MEPSLFGWVPYFGKKTKSKSILNTNTKHRKVNPVTKILEKDCREITEEHLLVLFSQSSVAELIKLEKSWEVEELVQNWILF